MKRIITLWEVETIKRKYNAWNDSARLNNRTFNYYYEMLHSISVNMIRWNGLPDSVDARFLEIGLIDKGYMLYFEDEVMGPLTLSCTLSDKLSVYNIPSIRRAYANNGYQAWRDYTNSVIIFNNYSHMPTAPLLELFAWRLCNIERTVDVNTIGQKHPKIILTPENQRLVLQNLLMQYEGNIPFIMGDKNLDLKLSTVLDTSSPYVADRLQILKRQVLNEALTFLGIENNSNEKAERQVTNEAIANVGAIQANRNAFLNARQQAADEINRMFGTNITVEYRAELSSKLISDKMEAEISEIQNGGGDSGSLHDGASNHMRDASGK